MGISSWCSLCNGTCYCVMLRYTYNINVKIKSKADLPMNCVNIKRKTEIWVPMVFS